VSSSLRIPHFDLIRAIAITSVVVSHIFNEENTYLENRYPLWRSLGVQILRAPVTTGGYVVALFLLLSGVLISRVIERESLPAFAVRRLFRIWPLYILTFLAHFTLLSITDFPSTRMQLRDLVGILTLMGDFWNAPLYLGFVDWSLRVEVVAYLLVTTVILFAGTTRRAVVMTSVAVVVTFAPSIPSGLFSVGYLNIHLPLFIAGFCFGSGVGSANGGRSLFQLLATLNIALVFVASSVHRPDLAGSPYFNANIVAAVATFFTLAILKPQTTAPIIRKVSESSYGIYLMHNWLVYAIAERLFGNSGLLGRSFSLILVIIIARLLYVYFETPIINFSKQVMTRDTYSTQTSP